MAVLICGVLLWSCVHLFPSVMPGVRSALITKLGNKPYRGLFALDIVIALALIVIGWRMADVRLLYVPPLHGSLVVPALVFVAFALFAAANSPGNIKRLLRHPMLTGVVIWSGAHLLANGENRSVVLFGGLGAWALLSMFLINRRDGARVRPPAAPVARDAITVLASGVLFGIVLYFHKSLFGVPALPGW